MVTPQATGRVTVVTGAGGGIGRASVLRLASRGDTVAALDVSGDALVDLADEATRLGLRVEPVIADVRDVDAIRRSCGALAERFGRIDYLFSNAGVDSIRGTVAQMATEDWDTVLGVHVTGAFNMCQVAIPHMRGGQEPAIVVTVSDYSIIGMEGNAAYVAAKTALYSFAKALASEFVTKGIRVNAVGPGPIDTAALHAGRSAEEYAERIAALVANVPMHRLGRPKEVASVVDFLLSPRSSYITGQLLHPNGGNVMW